MNQAESVAAMAACTNKTPREIRALFNAVRILAEQTVKVADRLVLPGLGRIAVHSRPARMGRNKAGQRVAVKAKRVVKFRVTKSLKDAILRPKPMMRVKPWFPKPAV